MGRLKVVTAKELESVVERLSFGIGQDVADLTKRIEKMALADVIAEKPLTIATQLQVASINIAELAMTIMIRERTKEAVAATRRQPEGDGNETAKE